VRVALLSDIHGNLTALEAVIADIDRRSPDAVVHGGDLVLMGAEPAQVVDRVRELGWPGVVGNTDELLWRPDERERQEQRAPKLSGLFRLLFDEYAPATRELLGDERLAWLRGLPAEERLGDLLVMHAAPGDLWRAPMPDATGEELSGVYGECGAASVAYGHIHRPYVRPLGPLTVANCGSVGLPWDGDPRASYLLVDDGDPRLIRVEYDVEREAATLERSGYPGAPRLVEMRRRGRVLSPEWVPG
jgi:predicted phosphodiesterase